MITLVEKSPLQTKLSKLEEILTLVDNGAKSVAHNLNEVLELFWSGSDAEIIELLNYLGPQRAEELFMAHWTNANNINTLLVRRGIEDPKCVVSRPREITFDPNTGLLGLVPLPAPEELPAPEIPVVQ